MWKTFNPMNDTDKAVDMCSAVFGSFMDGMVDYVTGKTRYGDSYAFTLCENILDGIAKTLVKCDKDIAKLKELRAKAGDITNSDSTQNGNDVGRATKDNEITDNVILSYDTSIASAELNRGDIHSLGNAVLTICKAHAERSEPRSAYTRSVEYRAMEGNTMSSNNKKMVAHVAKRKAIAV
jgi:hypothetical protein